MEDAKGVPFSSRCDSASQVKANTSQLVCRPMVGLTV